MLFTLMTGCRSFCVFFSLTTGGEAEEPMRKKWMHLRLLPLSSLSWTRVHDGRREGNMRDELFFPILWQKSLTFASESSSSLLRLHLMPLATDGFGMVHTNCDPSLPLQGSSMFEYSLPTPVYNMLHHRCRRSAAFFFLCF